MTTSYSRLQIALHWVVAALIGLAYLTGDDMGEALRDRITQGLTGFQGSTVHTFLGGFAFAFALWRLVVRLRKGAPEPQGSPLVQRAATIGHWALYALMVAVPALGAATWYGHLRSLGDVHETLGNLLIIVALGHVGAALWHHFVQKDGTLTRMTRPGA